MVNCINLIIEMSPRFVLGRENVPCVAEVVNRSLKADCTDFTHIHAMHTGGRFGMNKLKKTRAFFSSADTNLEVWDQTKIYLPSSRN